MGEACMTQVYKTYPYLEQPRLEVMDDGKYVNVDIQIPGVSKNRVEVVDHMPCIKKSVSIFPSQELVHITFPKEPYRR
jgi:hypothetical protein